MKKILFLFAIAACAMNAQNYMPLNVGNKYLYLNDHWAHQSGGSSYSTRSIGIGQITKDTVIGINKYYYDDGKWLRYDSARQMLFNYCGGSDSLVFNFNGPVSFPPNKCFVFVGYTTSPATKTTSSGSFFGRNYTTQGFSYTTDHGSGDISWAPDLGVVRSSSYYHDYDLSESMTSSLLIESVLYNNDTCVHNAYGYPASFTSLQNDLNDNKLQFYLMVTHPFTNNDYHFSFIDKIALTGYYQKDTSRINIDTLYFTYPGTDARLYKIDVPLDTFMLNNGYTFYYKAVAKDKGLIPVYTSFPDTGYLSKSITSVNEKEEIVTHFGLSQNYPNPFNPSTTVEYYIPSECKVNITVYNALGSKIKELYDGARQQGNYEAKFDGAGLSSGVYFVTIKAASVDGKKSFTGSKKMILLK
jgi:hypothetical protein